MTELATERLLLRPLRPGDLDDVHRYASDPEVTRFMHWGPNERAGTVAFLDAVPAGNFAIERRYDGRVIGATELALTAPEHRRGTMGYVLARDAWGSGYATEAGTALMAYGFGELGLRRIEATCDPENAGSARVLEKLGMAREGHLRSFLLIRGEWRDRLLYAAVDLTRAPSIGS